MSCGPCKLCCFGCVIWSSIAIIVIVDYVCDAIEDLVTDQWSGVAAVAAVRSAKESEPSMFTLFELINLRLSSQIINQYAFNGLTNGRTVASAKAVSFQRKKATFKVNVHWIKNTRRLTGITPVFLDKFSLFQLPSRINAIVFWNGPLYKILFVRFFQPKRKPELQLRKVFGNALQSHYAKSHCIASKTVHWNCFSVYEYWIIRSTH